MTLEAHREYIGVLLRELPDAQLVETHISSVILTRDRVYKFKKPVDYGFLDYSTLQKRHHCCLEELRVNRRGAASLYLGVVAVTGSSAVPVLEGEGEVIDYGVKMRRFDAAMQLDRLADAGGLDADAADTLAAFIASYHRGCEPVAAPSAYGTPERVLAPMRENFEMLGGLLENGALAEKLGRLEQWTLDMHARLTPLLLKRKAEGYVRECHGDLHLHNLAWHHGAPLLFDAIEFNPYLSHIDVISDLAFLLMDLDYRGLAPLGSRLLSLYLEHTGDYEGVRLLRFYQCYRAMVRAKVLALTAAQQDGTQKALTLVEMRRYVDLAAGYMQRRLPSLTLTCGPSGSGKSTVALMLVQRCGALRIRSDRERLRLFGGAPDRYAPEATAAVYGRLLEIAVQLIEAGIPVIVDATFLKRDQREPFARLAETFGVPCILMQLRCDPERMRERLEARRRNETDPSEADAAVLRGQLEGIEPPGDTEGERFTVSCDSRETMSRDVAALARRLCGESYSGE